MNPKIAKKVNGAIVNIGHPLLDFRRKEAKDKVRWVYKFLRPYIAKNYQLLDLGCGTGKQSFAAEELGARVFGIDCSRKAIDYANRIKKKIGSNSQFLIGDYTKTPFSESYFDIVIFPKNIIECSYGEIEKLSSEVRRILKEDGKFIVTMEDGFKKIQNSDKNSFSKKYCEATGKLDGEITLPNKRKYYYPTYFWTTSFAKHIFSRKFSLLEERKIDKDYYILVYVKKSE